VDAHEQHTVGATSFHETTKQKFTSGGSNAQEHTTTGSSGRDRSNSKLPPPQEKEKTEREFSRPPPRNDVKKEKQRSKSRSRSPLRRRDSSDSDHGIVRRTSEDERKDRRDSVFNRVGAKEKKRHDDGPYPGYASSSSESVYYPHRYGGHHPQRDHEPPREYTTQQLGAFTMKIQTQVSGHERWMRDLQNGFDKVLALQGDVKNLMESNVYLLKQLDTVQKSLKQKDDSISLLTQNCKHLQGDYDRLMEQMGKSGKAQMPPPPPPPPPRFLIIAAHGYSDSNWKNHPLDSYKADFEIPTTGKDICLGTCSQTLAHHWLIAPLPYYAIVGDVADKHISAPINKFIQLPLCVFETFTDGAKNPRRLYKAIMATLKITAYDADPNNDLMFLNVHTSFLHRVISSDVYDKAAWMIQITKSKDAMAQTLAASKWQGTILEDNVPTGAGSLASALKDFEKNKKSFRYPSSSTPFSFSGDTDYINSMSQNMGSLHISTENIFSTPHVGSGMPSRKNLQNNTVSPIFNNSVDSFASLDEADYARFDNQAEEFYRDQKGGVNVYPSI
jgi:hypothetical protein